MTDEDTTKRLTDRELQMLRDAGVSPEFLVVVQCDPEEVGRERNSAREAARKMVRSGGDGTPAGALPLDRYTGDYAAALRDGDLAKAFIRADITNTRLLVHLFGQQYITERLAARDKTYDSAARYVSDNVEEFAADLV